MINLTLLKRFIIALIMVFSLCCAQGTWKVFTQADGLSSNSAIDILEDSQGNLWFNTGNKGVMKYNGTNWINYSTNNGLLSNKHIIMHKHSDGTIIFGGRKGIIRYNGSTFEVITKKYGTGHIIEDSSGNIWFGTINVSCYYDGENIIRITKKRGNIPSKILSYYYYDKKNDTMWFGGRKGLSSFDGENWIIYSKEVGAPTTTVTTIVSDDDGVVWAGTNKGIYSYNGLEWIHYSIEEGLITDDILSLHKDNMNRIWAISGKKPIMPGVVWGALAALSKSGLQLYNDGKWSGFAAAPGVPNSKVRKMFETSTGDLWFDTDGDGIYKYDNSSWNEYNNMNGVSNHFSAIYEDSKGNLWFGLINMVGKGLGKFDGKEWTIYSTDTGLPSNGIESILEDSKGNMWFATRNGIVKYIP